MSIQEQVAQIAMILSENDAKFTLDFLSRIAPQSTEQVLGRGKRLPLDFNSYGKATESGKHVDEYLEEVRGNDRI